MHADVALCDACVLNVFVADNLLHIELSIPTCTCSTDVRSTCCCCQRMYYMYVAYMYYCTCIYMYMYMHCTCTCTCTCIYYLVRFCGIYPASYVGYLVTGRIAVTSSAENG